MSYLGWKDKISSHGLCIHCSEALGALPASVSMAVLNPSIKTSRQYRYCHSLIFWFLASYRSDFQNWGSVSGTQTGFSNIQSIYSLIQIQEKFTILPVSAVIPPTNIWIQHSVPHGKLL